MSRSNSPKRRHGWSEKGSVPAVGYCSGHRRTKRSYASKSQAKAALKAANRGRANLSGHAGRLETAVYKCSHCGGWHTTSKEQR